MINFLKTRIPLTLVAGLLLAALAGSFYAVPVSAQDVKDNLCDGAQLNLAGDNNPNQDCGDDAETNGGKRITTVINTIINVLSMIIGIVAVIMIIIGGFRFITADGDSGKINSARSTIIYALVGLVIVALAQFIVRFVVSKATKGDA